MSDKPQFKGRARAGGGTQGAGRGVRGTREPQQSRRGGASSSDSHKEQQPPAAQQLGRTATRGPLQGAGEVAEGLKKIHLQEPAAEEAGALQRSTGRGNLRGKREIAPIIRTRPPKLQKKQGTKGRPIVVQSNYFQLKSQTDWHLIQYHVTFQPNEERTFFRKGLLRIHREKLGGYIFDGTTLFTARPLSGGDNFELLSQKKDSEEIIQIIIKKVGVLSPQETAYLQVFNILMRRTLEQLNLQLVGRNYYDANAKIDIPEFNLQLWPGYETSIRQHEESILLNAEVSTKVLRVDTAYQLLTNLQQRYRKDYESAFKEAIIGSTVLTDYNNRTYRVDDVDFDLNPTHTFEMGRDKKKVSYIEYYAKRYDLPIRVPHQPLLVSKAKARDRRGGKDDLIYLVPEICRLTGLTDAMRSDFKLMQALAKYTRVPPVERIDKLKRLMRKINSTKEIRDDLLLWNLELDTELVSIQARVLDPEKIVHGRGVTSIVQDSDFKKNILRKEMVYAAPLNTWAVICTQRDQNSIGKFISGLQQASSSFFYNIPKPELHVIHDDKTGTYIQAIESVINRYNPSIILLVVPNSRADRYSAIKQKAYVDRGIPTQVVLAKNVIKNVLSINTKIAIQLNCKIGGAPWSCTKAPVAHLMVVGFDVCHDSDYKARSYGAMVASLNETFSRYYSAVSSHENGEELSNQISMQVFTACLKYREVNGRLPSKIVIYRDGVGDGQISHVYSHELEFVKRKLSDLYPDEQQLFLAFIIVSKRINTRFFLNGENAPPGTIVDDVVTFPYKYDFFLVPQSVGQGTVSPTSFNVIYDTSGINPDGIQRLSFRLCHLYFNWSGAVRVPAPCQFAHKLAFLVGQHIHRSPHQDLDNLLYYL